MSSEVKGHGEKFSRKIEQFVVALMSQPTVAAAGQVVGVSNVTARRWLQREDVQARYRQVQREALAHTVGRLQQATNQAVDTLAALMTDAQAPAAVKASAAKAVIDLALRGREHEDEQQLVLLEKAVKELEEEFQYRMTGAESLRRQSIFSRRSH